MRSTSGPGCFGNFHTWSFKDLAFVCEGWDHGFKPELSLVEQKVETFAPILALGRGRFLLEGARKSTTLAVLSVDEESREISPEGPEELFPNACSIRSNPWPLVWAPNLESSTTHHIPHTNKGPDLEAPKNKKGPNLGPLLRSCDYLGGHQDHTFPRGYWIGVLPNLKGFGTWDILKGTKDHMNRRILT